MNYSELTDEASSKEHHRIPGSVRVLWGFSLRLVSAAINVLALLLAVTIGVYYAARWTGFNQIWLISIIGHILPRLFLPIVFLLPAAVLRRSRWLQILVAILVALFVMTYGHLYVSRWPVSTVGPEFTVMSYNVRSSNRDANDVAAVIISEYEVWQLGEDRAYWAQQATLDIEGHWVNVVGVHLRYGPVLQGVQPLSLPLIVPTGSAGDSEGTDVHALLERLEGVRDPLVVMGDFNMTDQQDLYPLLLNRLCDSHRESGWGMGFTQAPLHDIGLTMLRIDYVFHSLDLISLHKGRGVWGIGSPSGGVPVGLAWITLVERIDND